MEKKVEVSSRKLLKAQNIGKDVESKLREAESALSFYENKSDRLNETVS